MKLKIERTGNDFTADNIIGKLYAVLWVLLTGFYMFEVPKIVFWAPIALFLMYLMYAHYKRAKINLTIGAAILLVFCIVYVYYTYNEKQSLYYQAYILLHTTLIYLLGYNFFSLKDPFEKRFETLKRLMLVISILYIIYVMLTFINYLKSPETAPADPQDRKYWSIWYPGRVTKTATGFCASMFFAVAWGSYSVFFANKRYEKIVGAVLIILCVAFNIYTRTRLLVFFTPVLLVIEFFVWLWFIKKKKRLALRVLLGCVGAGVLLIIIYSLTKNILKVQFANTIFYRFISMGIRSKRWTYMWEVIKDFKFSYMGGGVHSAKYGVPHNFWLYVYDFGGIIPFLVYMAFTVVMIIDLVRFYRNKTLSLQVKMFLSSFLFIGVLEFMFEDLMYALPSFVMLVHFVLGVISGASDAKAEPVVVGVPAGGESAQGADAQPVAIAAPAAEKTAAELEAAQAEAAAEVERAEAEAKKAEAKAKRAEAEAKKAEAEAKRAEAKVQAEKARAAAEKAAAEAEKAIAEAEKAAADAAKVAADAETAEAVTEAVVEKAADTAEE